MSAAANAFSVVHSVLSTAGLSFNALLIYLAFYKTPQAIRSYATLIINFAMTDFGACFFDFFVQQRIVPAGWTLAYVSVGMCTKLGPTVCYVGHSIFLHFLSHSLWSLLLSFSYRCYILYRPAPTRQTLVLIVLAVYQLSFFQCISFLWAQDDPEEIKSILQERFPTYDLTDQCVTGTKNILCFSAMFSIIHMTVPISPVYTVILILRRAIIGRLSFQGVSVSNNTKNLHSQLLMALTYQALIPGFYLLAVSSYALGQFGIYNSPLLEYLVFTSVILIPIFSPMTSFIFVSPYKKWIIETFSRAAKVEVKFSIANNFTSVAG